MFRKLTDGNWWARACLVIASSTAVLSVLLLLLSIEFATFVLLRTMFCCIILAVCSVCTRAILHDVGFSGRR